MASALGNDPDAIADTLLNHLGPHTIVLADKAYDADRIRELIQDQGATPNIPPKSNRRWKPCFSKRLYRERNLIERFFSLAANFLAMIQLASMRLWLRAYEYTAFFFRFGISKRTPSSASSSFASPCRVDACA
jgi:transposase